VWLIRWNGQKCTYDVRRPDIIRKGASVEDSVRDTQSFQLGLNICLGPEQSLGRSFGYPSEVRRNEQLDVYFHGGRSDLPLNIEGLSRNGTDDDLHASQGALDRFVIGIVDLDHLGVTLNGGLGALSVHDQWVLLSHIIYNVKTGWILYLSGEDDDFLDDSGSLVLQELLNDEVTEGTGPNDGEFRVSSHEPLCV
jgi:hypothetical protein